MIFQTPHPDTKWKYKKINYRWSTFSSPLWRSSRRNGRVGCMRPSSSSSLLVKASSTPGHYHNELPSLGEGFFDTRSLSSTIQLSPLTGIGTESSCSQCGSSPHSLRQSTRNPSRCRPPVETSTLLARWFFLLQIQTPVSYMTHMRLYWWYYGCIKFSLPGGEFDCSRLWESKTSSSVHHLHVVRLDLPFLRLSRWPFFSQHLCKSASPSTSSGISWDPLFLSVSLQS